MHPNWHCRPAIAIPLHSTKPRYLRYIALVILLVGGTLTSSFANDTLVISTKSKHHTHKLSKCDHPYTFLSDTLSSVYRDRSPRNTVYTICPRYPQQRIGVSFQAFDLAIGDTLFAYDGYNTEAPLLGVATGKGIQAAFGGEIFVSYSRIINPTSCITFQFHTNGDEVAGEGWEATVLCVERNLEIIIPHIPPQQFDCDPSFATVQIPPAQIISLSGSIPNDSTIVLIKDGNTGEVCGESRSSYIANTVLSNIFGPGTYVVEYISLLDNTIKGTTRFEVSPPPLECKESVTLKIGSNYQLPIDLSELIDNYCPPAHDIFQYNVIVRDQAGNFITHGNTLDGLPNFPLDKMTACSNESYFVEIQKEYGNLENELVCNSERLVQSCIVEIKLEDQIPPSFVEPATTYTLMACDYDLLQVLSTLPTPAVVDACGQAMIQIESAAILESNADCNEQNAFLITWNAIDDRGNSIKRFDTLKVVRPSILEIPVADISIYCPTTGLPSPIESINRPALLSGINIKGKFQLIDTIFLSTTETVCDYQLVLKENTQVGNCGNDIVRYWSLIDMCKNPEITVPLDTQIIQLIDTIAPIISCSDAASLSTAQVFALPSNTCQIIPNFPLPTATDDCDDNPIVKELTVETLANGEWSQMAISLFQTPLGAGTYRVSYVATDACGNTSSNASCYRYFSIEDTVNPIANCQQNISIQLDASGSATLSAAALDNGSSDNCGIVNLFIRRSSCSSNSFQMTASDYAPTVNFNCCDANSSTQVDLLVVDEAGNSSTCSTTINPLSIVSNSPITGFVEPAKTYTLTACDFDLLETISLLPIPAVADACGQSFAQIETATILNNNTRCDNQSDFIITWLATDNFGNTIRRFDTLKIERPILTAGIPSPDITAGCENNLSPDDFSFTPPSLITSIEINGQVQILDTTLLSVSETICDYQISFEDIIISGREINRIWSITDLCTNPATSTPIDTQRIQNIDNVAPTIACTNFSSLDNAEVIALPTDGCSSLVNFPLPTAFDNCDNNPVVREVAVEIFLNDIWSPIGTILSQLALGPGLYRVGYMAIDASGNQTNCHRYFSLQDTTPPVAICQSTISIQLDASGQATLSAIALNDSSFDNCGIDSLLIKRSECKRNTGDGLGEGDQRMEVQNNIIPDIDLTDWSPSISFDCCDLTNTALIELLVVDNTGNTSSCETIINQVTIEESSAFQFVNPAQTYTLVACNFDLLATVATLPIPAVTNACGASSAQIETTTILTNNTQCDNQSDFLITWLSTDKFGNAIRRFDTLKIERPSALQMTPSADITIRCEEYTTTTFPIDAPSLLTGIIIDGQFEIIDTLFLSLTETVCDFQLTYEEINPSPSCKDQISRIWSITDLCMTPSTKTPIDTQEIRLIDTTPPTINCNEFSSLDNAEFLFLSANNCEEIINLPLPQATDNCDTNPIVREVTLDLFVNQTWSAIGSTLSQTPLGPGTYRVGYEAIDDCGATANSDLCFRYFILEDSIPPVANCHQNIAIQLDQDGTTTLSVAEVNNNSSDNCGIVSQLIRRSACGGNNPSMSESPSDNPNDYSTSVQFDCCDAAGTIQVDLLVTDITGNSSTCRTIIEQLTIENQGAFEFVEPAKTYTLIACDFDLLPTIATLPIPAVTNVCGPSAAQVETTTILTNNTQCNNQSDFVITWQATDDFGNIIRRFDTLRIERPSPLPVAPSAPISIDCNDLPIDTSLFAIDLPRLLTGLIIDGQFQIFDSIFLSTTETVCDFQLSFELENAAANCGDTLRGIWSITDLCVDPSLTTPISEQEIVLVGNSPTTTTIICNESTTLENADTLFVSANRCEEVLNFPLPSATSTCPTNPTVRAFTVDRFSNQVWSSIGNTLVQTPLGPGTYRVGYEAVDACNMLANPAICYRHFVLVDTIPPIARCQQNISIQLDQNGKATLSAAELNNNSFDNCGIEILLTKRSACEDGDQRMEVVNDTIPGVNLNDWSPSLVFECCDLDGDVLLDLLVVDSFNNFSTCRTVTRVADVILPTCTPLSPATATCQEYEVTDLGRPTDINENNEFDNDEWLALLPNQVGLFNTRFGNALSVCSDNAACRVPAVEQQYQLIEGSCGSIQMKRRYRAIDFSGNTSPWLEQFITVTYLPNWKLELPADAMTNCDVGKIEDPKSPIQNGVCDDLVWNFRDSIVRFENGSIKEICRTFNIVNRCFGNMDNQWLEIPRPVNDQGVVTNPVIIEAFNYANEDHLTYTQKIRLVDNDAPFIVIGDIDLGIQGKGDVAPLMEEDQSLGAAPFECDEVREFSVFARDCNEPSTRSLKYNWEFIQEDQRIDAGSSSSFRQPVIPNTLYSVNWSVRDEFGNQVDTTVTYEFIDVGPPTTLCKNDIRAIIDINSRDITITTDSLNAGSFDNCNDQLQIGLFMWNESVVPDTPSTIEAILQLPTEITFTCLDTGDVELFLYSTDQSGNFSYCSTTVEIIGNPDIDCNETMLSGAIVNRFGHPITGVDLKISGDKSTMDIQSSEVGQFDQMLPLEDTYTIRPLFNKHPLNGVSTYDLILISKHILGEQLFDSPYQYIAADVNQSGSITIFDIVQLRQLILNQIHEFPNNTSWRFVNADFEFLTDRPLAEVFPEHYEYNATTPEHLNMDFIGVKIGDLNGNADTYNLNTSTAQSRQSGTTFFIHTNPISVQKGKRYTLPFYAPSLKEIAGFQATFKFHDLILTNFEEGVVTSENIHGWRKNQEGFLTASWHSLLSHDNNTSELFTLTVEATKDGYLQELLEITSNPTPAEAYSLSGNRLEVALTTPNQTNKDLMNFGFPSTPLPHAEGIRPIPIPSVSGVFELYQNQPNPFSETTTISFYLPEAALTALSVFDVHGRNILQTQQHYETGTHTITLNSDQMPIGTYFYQVATPFGVATKKMTIIH